MQADSVKLSVVEAAIRLHDSLDVSQVAAEGVKLLSTLARSEAWAIYVKPDEAERLEIVDSVKRSDVSLPESIDLGQDGLTSRCLAQDSSVIDEAPIGSRSMYRLASPLTVNGSLVGVVHAFRNSGENPGGFSALDVANVELVCRSLARATANAVEYGRATRQTLIDDLTRLYNVRYLYQTLSNEIRRARRYGSAVSVVFMDLDGFKLVNDAHGHRIGSLTLAEVAQVILDSVREADFVSRYGGDEFVLLLPETAAPSAIQVAERVRAHIASHTFGKSCGAGIRLTASFGIASFPEHAVDAEKLIEMADAAMYGAKQNAKNSVRLAAHGNL